MRPNGGEPYETWRVSRIPRDEDFSDFLKIFVFFLQKAPGAVMAIHASMNRKSCGHLNRATRNLRNVEMRR